MELRLGTDDRLLIAALNRCIEACVDAQRAYGIAAATARSVALKETFQHRAFEREGFVVDLQRAIASLGGFPENQGSVRGAARRRWMDMARNLEPAHDDRHVVAELLREERAALDAYDAAVPEARTEVMSADLRVMIREQRAAMELAVAELARVAAA